MTPALDEVSTEYGLLAEAVSYPDDYSIGHLSPARQCALARRQAGDAEDVIFSFDAFKNNSPQLRAPITGT